MMNESKQLICYYTVNMLCILFAVSIFSSPVFALNKLINHLQTKAVQPG